MMVDVSVGGRCRCGGGHGTGCYSNGGGGMDVGGHSGVGNSNGGMVIGGHTSGGCNNGSCSSSCGSDWL